MKVKLDIGT